jgi:expansin (peptidoglycan-binding protein)
MSVELKYIHKDGSIRWWTVDAVKISDDRFIGFSIDITDRKQAEEDLINLSRLDYLTGYTTGGSSRTSSGVWMKQSCCPCQ